MRSVQPEAIATILRVVTDLDRTERFYREGLEFVRIAAPITISEGDPLLLGTRAVRASVLPMRLGAQTICFLATNPPVRPYDPVPPPSNDPAFQHIAIVVSDMAAAMAHLDHVAHRPISRDGPQHLPKASGGVIAYKFRDPDGHPLELLQFPSPGREWAVHAAAGPFLGIDHSAITVADLDRSCGFFTEVLGLRIEQKTVNRGPEQARLDDVPGPVVDVVALSLVRAATPHVELLHYRRATGRSALREPQSDRVTTRLVFTIDDPAAPVRSRDRQPSTPPDARSCLLTEPDGHEMLLVSSADLVRFGL